MVWTRVRDLRISGERQFTPLPHVAAHDLVENGLDVPLLATSGEPRTVLLGTRRAAAIKARLRPDDRVPVYVADRSSELIAWLEADAALPGINGMPWSWSQRGNVARWVLRDLNPRAGEPRIVEPLAAYFGVHEVQLRAASYLLKEFENAEPGGKVQWARAIEAVERGELLPQSAYTRVRGLRQGRTAGFAASGDPRPAPTMSAAEQRRALARLGTELSGLVLGIERIGPVHDELTEAERKELAKPLIDARQALVRLVRYLNNTPKGEGS